MDKQDSATHAVEVPLGRSRTEARGERLTRRRFLEFSASAGLLAFFQRMIPAYAQQAAGTEQKSGPGARAFDLVIDEQSIRIAGRDAKAMTINGSLPGPLLRFREGENVTIRVTNRLKEPTSIHWHGLLVPADMDGVPGVSFAGIKPGETFTYRYAVKQSGTYWYHSHSATQEQSGIYGPLVIDPAESEPIEFDREYVVMLSDWTFEDPGWVLQRLRSRPGYYNFQQRTVFDFANDVRKNGWWPTISERLEWNQMRMDPTDIADVTHYTYTFLVNGLPPDGNWTALFKPGERVRLRFINGAAVTYFDVRIPGLAMTVVQADGQNIQPVTVEEFRIAVAETYDVIVTPQEDRAYTIFAESQDRSGYTRATFAPRNGMAAPIPERRPRPVRTMADMGMGDMTDGSMAAAQNPPMKQQDTPGMDMPVPPPGDGMKQEMPGMNMPSGSMSETPAPMEAGVMHGPDTHGPGNSTVAMTSRSRLNEPGIGLGDDGRRVLVYTDLRSFKPGYDQRKDQREIELHLTGNMERYMWSINGKAFWEVKDPIAFSYGERLRVTFVNDTMMDHPMHLHGMWMDLDNGTGAYKPRKHTINVKPAERLSFVVTADAPGNWAFHCHILYHMEMGMFRVVSVTQRVAEVKR
jgi:CopA family copper-resistance protein